MFSMCVLTVAANCLRLFCCARLGYSSEEILGMFFDTSIFHQKKDGFTLELDPERLRGEITVFDIKDKKGAVVVEKGRRVTARHIRDLEKGKVTSLEVPAEYLLGRATAEDIADPKTGELLFECNTEFTSRSARAAVRGWH